MNSSSGKKKSIILVIAILLIMVALIIVMSLSLRTNPVEESLSGDHGIAACLVINDGEGNPLVTNVVLYYPPTQMGALFNIPGNVGGIYSSLGRVDRIDVVYSEKGMQTYSGEIAKLFRLDIPFTLDISLQNLGILTDLLGGLRVFVPSPVDVVGPEGERWLLPSGVVNLDGDKIQTYMQYFAEEEAEGARADRRQNVIIALISALREKRSVMFSKKNFAAFGELVDTNMNQAALYTLLEMFSHMDSERLSPQTITGSLRNTDGKLLLFPFYNGQLIKDVVMQRMAMLRTANEEMQMRVYVVEIQNGTGTQGLARNTAALLSTVGYDVLQAVNADRDDYEHTVIINHIGNKEAAESLGNFITCYNIKDEEVRSLDQEWSSAAEVDFTLILGSDFDGRYVRGGYVRGERNDKN